VRAPQTAGTSTQSSDLSVRTWSLRWRWRLTAAVAVVSLALSITLPAQSSPPTTRRLTTIDALHQFPGYFHQQNVLVRGEFVEQRGELVLSADSQFVRLINPSQATHSGVVEVRGQIFDVGKLDPTDGRLGPLAERFKSGEWPRPGMELALNITGVVETPPSTPPSIRALALQPSKYEGQTVTVIGNFRGRNLFADMPEAPGKSKYDFVMTAAEGALWVTGLRPRGKGFDLDVERRMDSGHWLEVTGTVSIHRGLALIAASKLVAAEAPTVTAAPPEPAAPRPPPAPAEVVFSAPTADETDVPAAAPIRIQFSRGLREATLADHVRVSYVGGDATPLTFKTAYDVATRGLQITFAAPLVPYRTVKVELLDGIQTFDGAPLKPWSITFAVGR
jgi:hypothetical protein